MARWCEDSHVHNFIFTRISTSCGSILTNFKYNLKDLSRLRAYVSFFLIFFPLFFCPDHKWCEICHVFVEFSIGSQKFMDSLTYPF